MMRQPSRTSDSLRHDPGLQRPDRGRDGRRGAPRENEPEHVLRAGRPQEQQSRQQGHRPDQVVEECLAAPP